MEKLLNASSPPLVLPIKKPYESQLTSDKLKQFKEEKSDLDAIEGGEWLTDSHMSPVNEILKNLFPSISGLQNSLYGQNLTFERLSRPFVQIQQSLAGSARSSWITHQLEFMTAEGSQFHWKQRMN